MEKESKNNHITKGMADWQTQLIHCSHTMWIILSL